MKVTVASLDPFWLIEQAAYLSKEELLDHCFVSRPPKGFAALDRSQVTTCLPLHYSLRILQRHWASLGGSNTYLKICKAFDWWLETKLPRRSDILAVLSGVGLKSFRVARRTGTRTVVECGSTHTDYQDRVVREELQRNGINAPLFPDEYRTRVRTEFAETDFIQVPSRFVGSTFIDHGVPPEKLLYATYGVDLGKFIARNERDANGVFRAICPSGVNLRKGARVLADAWRKAGLVQAELHWVGHPDSTTKHLFEDKPDSIVFHPWLNHDELSSLYRKCDVFVLPSFEEGFARVMLEAAASGLPLIATPNTGVEDFFDTKNPEGFLIPTGDIDATCEALRMAASNRGKTFELGRRATAKAQSFTWNAYGARVVDNYRRAIAAR